MTSRKIVAQFTIRREFWLHLMVYIIGIHGLFVIALTLVDQFRTHPGLHINDIDIDVPLLIGFGLVYLSTLLRRRKRTAWFIAVLAYIFMLGFYVQQLGVTLEHHEVAQFVGKLGLPLLNIGLLMLFRKRFTVKSDIRSFGYALRFIVLILLTALFYGVAGFMLMNTHDFHQEITFGKAVHQTVDQFGLTTTTVVPHTRRARLFVDSLSVVSIATVTTAAVSLFQPIRARYNSRHIGQPTAQLLLNEHGGSSEDFFKLWPHDKAYFFDADLRAGVAYRARGGIALVISDPFGDRASAPKLLEAFEDYCYGNDWSPVFVHTTPSWSNFYEAKNYRLQKIGEEAVVDLENFAVNVRPGKYFREIRNKFDRKGYTTDVLLPPHDDAVISRLRVISDDWLQKPGRAERGLVMGYFSESYMQQCEVIVARDSAGTIQGFINRITSYDAAEANFDLLRHASTAQGNINDFLLLSLIDYVSANPAIKRLNLGLCPLSGMEDVADRTMITRALEFVYANGDRFYSFTGLRRFKSKYQPDWQDRYVAYKGGPANFARAMTVLTRTMRVSKQALREQ